MFSGLVPVAEALENFKAYLGENYPQFAEPTVRTISQRVGSLKRSPHKGRRGQRSGTRELTMFPLPYVVVYAVQAEAVGILPVYHGAQDWR